MLYFGTALVRGECTALVCATGDKTELGKIAVSSENMTRELSPLQKELNTLGGKITRNLLCRLPSAAVYRAASARRTAEDRAHICREHRGGDGARRFARADFNGALV
jgi:magnesium-transporting ATPase (P-type)